MKKIILLLLLVCINSFANRTESVSEIPPKKGTPEEFVVNFVKKINSSDISSEDWEKNYCTKKLLAVADSETTYKNMKSLDLSKRFKYRARMKDKGKVQVLISSTVKGKATLVSIYFYIKKIDGKYKCISKYRN